MSASSIPLKHSREVCEYCENIDDFLNVYNWIQVHVNIVQNNNIFFLIYHSITVVYTCGISSYSE